MVPNTVASIIQKWRPLCSWGPSMLQMFLVPFPRAVPRHNPVSELYGQFLQPHGLVFALTYTVNRGTLYRQVCSFPNHVQSIEFTPGGLQSSCRNISRMINGNRMHMSSISSLIAKGLNTYVNKVFLLLICNTFANISKNLFFALLLCGIVCRLLRIVYFVSILE